jgi:hypothetical protein
MNGETYRTYHNERAGARCGFRLDMPAPARQLLNMLGKLSF